MVAHVSFEKSFIFDGVPILQADPNPKGVTFALQYPTTQVTNFTSGVPMCAPFHYHHAIYDPTAVLLFAPAVDSPQNLSPTESRNRQTATIVGGVIGGLVLAAVVVVSVLVITVPSVRRFVQPFSKRAEPDMLPLDDTKERVSQNRNWAHASKPTSP